MPSPPGLSQHPLAVEQAPIRSFDGNLLPAGQADCADETPTPALLGERRAMREISATYQQ